MQSLEGQFDCATEQLFEVGLKLEQKEKVIRLENKRISNVAAFHNY